MAASLALAGIVKVIASPAAAENMPTSRVRSRADRTSIARRVSALGGGVEPAERTV